MADLATKKQTFFFALYALPTVAVTAAVATYLPAFYSEQAGIGLATIGLIFFALRIFDFFSDLLIGICVDLHPFKQAKYRPWITLSVPITMLGVFLLYLPNNNDISSTYIFIAGLIMYSGYTLANLTHQAWGAESLAGTPRQSTFFGYREICLIIGIVIAYAIPAIVEINGGKDYESKVNAIGYFLLITLPIFAVFTLISLKDVKTSPENKERFSWKKTKNVIFDKNILNIVIAKLLFFLGLISAAALSSFLVKHYFHLGDYFARIQAIYFITAMLFVFIWMALAKKYGEKKTLKIAVGFMVLGHLSVLIPVASPNVTTLTLHYFLAGAGFGAGPFLLRAMAANEATWIDNNTDNNARGVIFGMITLFEKLGGALAIIVTLPMLEFLGFNAKADIGDSVASPILYLYLFVPIISYLVILLPLSQITSRVQK